MKTFDLSIDLAAALVAESALFASSSAHDQSMCNVSEQLGLSYLLCLQP